MRKLLAMLRRAPPEPTPEEEEQPNEPDSLETVLASFDDRSEVLADNESYVIYNVNYGDMEEVVRALSQRTSGEYEVVNLSDIHSRKQGDLLVYFDINSNYDDGEIVKDLTQLRVKANEGNSKIVFITNGSAEKMGQIYKNHVGDTPADRLANTDYAFSNVAALFLQYESGQLVNSRRNRFS